MIAYIGYENMFTKSPPNVLLLPPFEWCISTKALVNYHGLHLFEMEQYLCIS